MNRRLCDKGLQSVLVTARTDNVEGRVGAGLLDNLKRAQRHLDIVHGLQASRDHQLWLQLRSPTETEAIDIREIPYNLTRKSLFLETALQID
jgi:hypothetical protein